MFADVEAEQHCTLHIIILYSMAKPMNSLQLQLHVITARCYAQERGYATEGRLSVRLSVRDVQVP